MTNSSTNLSLPFLLSSQTQKHATYNEAIVSIDNLLMLNIKSRQINSPPNDAIEGDRYIIPSNSIGEWSDKNGQIAAYNNLAWNYYPSKSGFLAFISEENLFLVFDGLEWQDLPIAPSSLQNLNGIGIGTISDNNNPFAAKLNDALFSAKYTSEAGNGDIRIKINKESTSKSSSLLFQDNWSARAEIGLCGDNDLQIKVTPNGNNWIDALRIDKTNGALKPKSISHYATNKPMYGYLPTSTTANSELYRIDETCGPNPRTAIIFNKNNDIINLTTNTAFQFHTSAMSFTSVRIWNKTKNPIQSAWVMCAPNSNQLQVTDSSHIANWSNGDLIQFGDDPVPGASFGVVSLDISRLLIEKFGTTFRQSAIVLNGSIITGSINDTLAYSPTGFASSLVNLGQYGAQMPPGIFTCSDLSPISNSNLVRIKETFASVATIRLIRMSGVFA